MSTPKENRKIIQLLIAKALRPTEEWLYALADDGSVWIRPANSRTHGWQEIPSLPGDIGFADARRPADPAERSHWQLIQTAPKDGTVILLADYRYPDRPEISSGFWENGNWTDGSLELSPLTHWQSLPEPPESSK